MYLERRKRNETDGAILPPIFEATPEPESSEEQLPVSECFGISVPECGEANDYSEVTSSESIAACESVERERSVLVDHVATDVLSSGPIAVCESVEIEAECSDLMHQVSTAFETDDLNCGDVTATPVGKLLPFISVPFIDLDKLELKDVLAIWAVVWKIKRSSVTQLLKMLRRSSAHNPALRNLPLNCETLLKQTSKHGRLRVIIRKVNRKITMTRKRGQGQSDPQSRIMSYGHYVHMRLLDGMLHNGPGSALLPFTYVVCNVVLTLQVVHSFPI